MPDLSPSLEARAQQFAVWRDVLSLLYTPIVVSDGGLVSCRLWDLAVGPLGSGDTWFALLLPPPDDGWNDPPPITVLAFEPFNPDDKIYQQIRDGLRAGIAARFTLLAAEERPIVL